MPALTLLPSQAGDYAVLQQDLRRRWRCGRADRADVRRGVMNKDVARRERGAAATVVKWRSRSITYRLDGYSLSRARPAALDQP